MTTATATTETITARTTIIEIRETQVSPAGKVRGGAILEDNKGDTATSPEEDN